MIEKNYLNFDLLIERLGTEYRARASTSAGSEAMVEFDLAPLWPELAKPSKSNGTAQRDAGKIFCIHLFNSVFAGDVGFVFRLSLEDARRQNAGLRIRLRLNDVPELHGLPWEALYSPALQRYLSLDWQTPIVRYPELPYSVPPMQVKPPLGILVVTSLPSDLQPIDIESEWKNLKEAVADLEEKGLVWVDRLDEVTLQALDSRLKQSEYHILHYAGHGCFDQQSQESLLVFQEELQGCRYVSGQELGALLHNYPSVRLMILNNCAGAQSSDSDSWASVAQGLIKQRIPAVIAMRGDISDPAAVIFAPALYQAISFGEPLESATASARRALYHSCDDCSWSVPVLYLRSEDGRIFEMALPNAEDLFERQITSLIRKSAPALTNGDFDTAWKIYQRLLEIASSDARTAQLLIDIQERKRLLEHYETGIAHYEKREWGQAIEYFKQIILVDRNYKDALELWEYCCKRLPEQVPPSPYSVPEPHYETVLKAMSKGQIVFVLGAGVNQCGWPGDTQWNPGNHFPGSRELADYLAKEFGFPSRDYRDLAEVTQRIVTMNGSGPLYQELFRIFCATYAPTEVHKFLTRFPAQLRASGHQVPPQLIITTNYDDLMEKAMREAGEPFDLVIYLAVGEHCGKFLHCTHDGQERLIEKPNEYHHLSLEAKPIIMKIHGSLQRNEQDLSSFVITEDDYIDYLSRMGTSAMLPITIAAKLRRSHFLFLGYRLKDWNLRVILHRIWGEQMRSYKSWAIQIHPQEIDKELWRKRNVDIFDIRLEDYFAELNIRLHQQTRSGGGK